MFWWVFDLFFCIKGATASGDQKWTWPMLKLLYNRESSLVLSVPRGVGWRGGEGDSRGRRCESESCSIVSNSLWPHGLYGPWNSPGQNTEVGVAFPFSRGSSQPRDQTQVSHIAGRFFTSWATREVQEYWSGSPFPSPRDLLQTQVSRITSRFFISWADLLYIKV